MTGEEEDFVRDGEVKELLQQLYGILDDWRANKFGGETLADAIDKLAAVAGTAPKPTAELKKISDTLDRLVDTAGAQPPASTDMSRQLEKIAGALEQIADSATAQEPTDEGQQAIRANFAEIAVRMGTRLDTGNDAVAIEPIPTSSLSDRDPILPDPVFPGGDASIYGVGLDTVREVQFDGECAAIRRRAPGEVRLTVPSDLDPRRAKVTILLPHGRHLTLWVDVIDEEACGEGLKQQQETEEVTT